MTEQTAEAIKKMTVAVIGGDFRQIWAADTIKKAGAKCITWGISGTLSETSLETAADMADVILLPIPAERKAGVLNCGDGISDADLTVDLLAKAISPGALVIGGKLSRTAVELFEAHGAEVIDYNTSERFQQINARLTAESAIMLAKLRLPKTLKGAKVAIVGYGRIGKFLGEMLELCGSHPVIVARSEASLALAASRGHEIVRISDEDKKALCGLGGCDVVFNTVPAVLFGKEELCTLRNTCFIELASLPGGVDIPAAEELGLQIINGRGLPGKYSPVSAGAAIGECVVEYISQNIKSKERTV